MLSKLQNWKPLQCNVGVKLRVDYNSICDCKGSFSFSFSLYFNIDMLLKFTVFIGIIAVFVEGEICVLHLIVKWLCL